MAKAKPSPASIQARIERLEKKKLLMQSKADLLLKGVLDTK